MKQRPPRAESAADTLRRAVRAIAARCPRLIARCYWAGTSAISLEELGHRNSFDLDFHTREPLVDVRPLLAELERGWPGKLEVATPPDAFGSGFTAILELARGVKVPIEVFAGFEAVPERDLVASATEPRMSRVSLARYLADKIQCVVERVEARDLVDIAATVGARPALEPSLRRLVAGQDPLLLAERLLGWTDESIRDDLRGYPDVDPSEAIGTRDRLLALLPEDAG